MIYALGAASKEGIKIENDKGKKRKVAPVKIGTIPRPNLLEMVEFIDSLNGSDTVLSVRGPNETYLAGAFRKGAEVRWISSSKYADEVGKRKKVDPHILLELYKEKPDLFLEYMEDDFQIAELDVLYANWLKIEKEKVALENSLSHTFARELEASRLLLCPSKKEWVEEKVENMLYRLQGAMRKGGIKLSKEDMEQSRKHIEEVMETIYDICMGGDFAKIQKQLNKLQGLEMIHVQGLLKMHKRQVESFLKTLPHYHIISKGFKGIGPKSGAGILVTIGNPLQYPSFPNLNSYVGMRVVGGHAILRYDPENKENLRYDHEGHTVLCYHFANKAHCHDPFFFELFRTYRLHQHLVYWPLEELTTEIFKYWKKDKGPSRAQIIKWLSRLEEMAPELPMIQRSKKQQEMIAKVMENPTWPNLRKLFSKEKGGGNLQMTATRIKNQGLRLNGITFARIAYYRWLDMLERELPLNEDIIYQQQCKAVGANGGVYDPRVHLWYYQKRDKELQEMGKTLPDEVWKKYKLPLELRIKK